MLSEDELKSVPVLVFANKQDVEGALSPGDISEKLGLAGQEKGREWSVRGSCATKGEGLEEGLDWYVILVLRYGLKLICSGWSTQYRSSISCILSHCRAHSMKGE